MIAAQLHPQIIAQKIKVWVLAPYLVHHDINIDHYYDFSQSIAEFTQTFKQLNLDWQWQPVTVGNYKDVIDEIVQEQMVKHCNPVILNLCDGDEVNGTPGISVIKYLVKKGLLFTGSDEYFYDVTTSKISMKNAFDKAKVPTPKWKAILNASDNHLSDLFDRMGSPIILKPSISGGSMGVGIKNVVYSPEQLEAQMQLMFKGYRGWQLAIDGLVAEEFINGPEFTVFIVGNHDKPDQAIIYPPVERVFHDSLPEHEKFLSFDRLWEIYEEEKPMPNEENFYEYAIPDMKLHAAIKQIAWDAYVAVKGMGYTRIDIRVDKETGRLYVLEVNAQCGISEDEDYTSIGAILKFANTSFTELVVQIINNSLNR